MKSLALWLTNFSISLRSLVVFQLEACKKKKELTSASDRLDI